MRTLKNTILCSLLACSIQSATAQQQKQPRLLELGAQAVSQLQYARAVTYYQQYLQTTRNIEVANKTKAQAALADCFWKMREYIAADYWYRQLPETINDPLVRFRRAELLARRQQYAAAAQLLSGNTEWTNKAQGYSNTALLVKDSADWTIGYLNINTPYYREFSPLLAGSSLIWSTNEPTIHNKEGVMGWDGKSYARMVLLKDQSGIQSANIPENIPYDSALQAISKQKALVLHYSNADIDLLHSPLTLPTELYSKRLGNQELLPLGGLGKYKFNQAQASYLPKTKELFLSVNQQEKQWKKIRRIGITNGKLEDGNLTNIKFLPINSTDYSIMHPAIHPEGNQLVFASDKSGGKGGFDLYLIKKINDSSWTEPIALNELNTAGNEVFPSFNQQGDLIFSSDGQAGLGGLDLYQTSGSNYQESNHLPSPLNSSADDFGYTIQADGKTGFFTSDRYGSDDIFKFNYAPVQTKLKGTIISRRTKSGVEGAPVQLYKKTLRKDGTEDWVLVEEVKSDGEGNFVFHTRPNNEYKISLNYNEEKQNSFSSTENKFKDQQLGAFYVDQEPILIVDPDPKNFIIHFDFDKSVLKPESIAILDEAIRLLKSNESLLIWLDAHTDFEGTDSYNISLSGKRLEETTKYLKEAGISQERILGKYHGELEPVELSRKWNDLWKNRRVEIRIWK